MTVKADEDECFSHALTNFLEQQCMRGAEHSIDGVYLFSHFRAFWMQAPERFDPPALLGQFRVELAQRGFLSTSDRKHPLWVGLILRKRGEQKPQGDIPEKKQSEGKSAVFDQALADFSEGYADRTSL